MGFNNCKLGESMKSKLEKFFVALIAACIALAFSGCKEKESQVENINDLPVAHAPKVDVAEIRDSSDVTLRLKGSFVLSEESIKQSERIHLSTEDIKRAERKQPGPRSASRSYFNPKDFSIKSENGEGRAAPDIMKVLRRRVPELRLIYNKHLEKKPGFEGKIVIEFTITPKGKITNISIVSSNTYFEEFDSEIVKAVSRWKFPKIKSGNTMVKLPFLFYE